MARQAVIFGCAGPTLTPDEVAFFRDADPWGFIVFRRNCESAGQVRALTDALREAVGWNAPVLVDHEGGRVARLSPQIAPKRPAMGLFAELVSARGLAIAKAAAMLGAELLARDAHACGLNVNCVPMLDVRTDDADDIIGDRALGQTAAQVAALGEAVIAGTLRGGCLPVIKHMPGHGRATMDSHLGLPTIAATRQELAADFEPFRALNHTGLGMTAHLVFQSIDPNQPATLSKTVIAEIIRGEIGFDGLLMTDDLSMKALTGSFTDRAERALSAGCDVVLHCNGELSEMQAVAAGVRPLAEASDRRATAALAQLTPPTLVKTAELEEAFASLTNGGSLSA